MGAMQVSTQKGDPNESKTQEVSSSWENDDSNDSSWQTPSDKDYAEYSNPLVGGPKEAAYYSTRDLPSSIQNVFRNRSIANHKKNTNDSKQAVKISSFEPSSPAASGQISHKSSLYKQLADKHLSPNTTKQMYEIAKDACQETVESLKRRTDDIHEELNKLIAETKKDDMSKRGNQPRSEASEKAVTSPSIMSQKSNSGNMEKAMSQANFSTGITRKLHSKNPQIDSEDWLSLSESRNTNPFQWAGTTSIVKEKTSNSDNGLFYQTYDPNYSFKLDM